MNQLEEKNSLSRREFLKNMLLGTGALILSSCKSDITKVNTITLSFWTPGGTQAWCPDAINKSMKAYSNLHPEISFTEVLCGTGDQNFQEVLLASIAAGTPPDSVALYTSPVSLGARGALVSLDSMLPSSKYAAEKNWPDGVIASCKFDGKTWGLPVTIDTYGMWYNQEWFEEKGIPSKPQDFPKNWDELRYLSKEFTRWDGDKLVSAGFIPWRDARELPIWSALNGGKIYDAENKRYLINSKENVYLMEYAVDWLNEEYKGDINKINASGYWGAYPGPQGQPPAFQDGRLAIMINGSWIMGDFYASIEPKFTRWNVASFPIGPLGEDSVSGYWPTWVAIPNGTEYEKAAFDWLDYLSGEGVKIWFEASPNLPANKNISDELIPPLLITKRGTGFARETMRFFRNQLDIAIPMWDSPIQSFAEDQLWRVIDLIMTKSESPKDALTKAQIACQSELDSLLLGNT